MSHSHSRVLSLIAERFHRHGIHRGVGSSSQKPTPNKLGIC
ncbi:hypothetical protein [Paenibacillus cremeus]|nr:hypothetical protein [Paenibacillus cremeus]